VGKLVIEDDGRPEIEMNGKTVAVNVFETYFQLRELLKRANEKYPGDNQISDRQREYLSLVADYLKDLGFGDVTFRLADLFDDHIENFATELGKVRASAPTPA
jgi:hypothetical protein